MTAREGRTVTRIGREQTPAERTLAHILANPPVRDEVGRNFFGSCFNIEGRSYGLVGTKLVAEWDALTEQHRECWRNAAVALQRQMTEPTP